MDPPSEQPRIERLRPRSLATADTLSAGNFSTAADLHREMVGLDPANPDLRNDFGIILTKPGFRTWRENVVNAGSVRGPEHAAGNTEEMYATSTSGMGPTVPASASTGRSFIPAVSPNGKLARQISPGCIYGLAIRQRIKVLPHIAQLVTPGLRHIPGPKGARLIFIRPDNDQMYTPGRQVLGRFRADLVVFVDFAHYTDGSHSVGLPSFSHQFATSGPAAVRGRRAKRPRQTVVAIDISTATSMPRRGIAHQNCSGFPHFGAYASALTVEFIHASG